MALQVMSTVRHPSAPSSLRCGPSAASSGTLDVEEARGSAKFLTQRSFLDHYWLVEYIIAPDSSTLPCYAKLL